MQLSCRTKPRLRLEQSRPASAVGVEPPWCSAKRRRRVQSFTKELQEKKEPKDKGRKRKRNAETGDPMEQVAMKRERVEHSYTALWVLEVSRSVGRTGENQGRVTAHPK